MNTNIRLTKAISKLVDKQKDIKEKLNKLISKQEKLEEIQESTGKEIVELSKKVEQDQKQFNEKLEQYKHDKPKDGKNGKDGKDGKNGRDGKDGLDGKNGKDGKDGLSGKNGLDGKNGKDGTNGKDGIGIKDVHIDKKGQLIITLTNDKEINCGVVKGKNGIGIAGSNGISVTEVKVIDNHLIVKLSNNKVIDAGEINVAEEGVLTKDSILQTIEECEECTGEQVPAANLMAMTYNSIPRMVSEVENDVGYITEETDPTVPSHVKNITENDIKNWNNKFDKTGGTVKGVVFIEDHLDIKARDEDFDTGIKFKSELNDNYGSILTLNGYANSSSSSARYKPILRNIEEPVNDYDVANKKYVDEHIVIPNYYLVFLNDDGTVDTATSSLKYETVKSNLTDPLKEDILDVVWGTTRFYAECVEIIDVNTGDIKFITNIEYHGIERRMVFTLGNDNVLRTTLITTPEIIFNKTQDIVNNYQNKDLYPSVWAVFNQFQRKPDIIYDNANGFEAVDEDVGESWALTDLDLSKYKRLKFYVKSGGDTDSNLSPSHIVEMHLDDRAKGTLGVFYATHTAHNPNNRNRLHIVSFAVNSEKTAIQFTRSMSLYGTSATNSIGGRGCYLIEGYYE